MLPHIKALFLFSPPIQSTPWLLWHLEIILVFSIEVKQKHALNPSDFILAVCVHVIFPQSGSVQKIV